MIWLSVFAVMFLAVSILMAAMVSSSGRGISIKDYFTGVTVVSGFNTLVFWCMATIFAIIKPLF